MAPISYNARALKLMLLITIPTAGPLGLTHLLRPQLLTGYFGAPARKSPYLYSDAFMGSTFLAFATTALIGLLSGDTGAFVSLIMLQCAYKVYHGLAFLATRAPLDAHNALYMAVWVAFIAGDLAVFAPALCGGAREPKEGSKKQT
jgi:hypothetical protein